MAGAGKVLLLALLVAACYYGVSAEDVITLDINNFDTEIAKHDFIVVEFYAPWCGHCKSLAPEYEKAAGTLKKHDPPIVLAKCDANDENNKPLASKYGVQGFPTLKIFRGGKLSQDYNGPRDADGIVSYLKKQAGPASVELTPKNAEEYFKENPVTAVGVFKSLASDDFKEFMATATSLRVDYSFAHTTDESVLPKKDKKVSVPGIRLFKDFDEGYNDFNKFSNQEVSTFLASKTVPRVVEMSKDDKNRKHLMAVFGSELPKILVLWDYSSAENTAIKESLDAAAQKFDDLKFISGNAKDNENALQYFGLDMDKVPVYIVHDSKNEKKYIKENVKPEELVPWLDDYQAGKLLPSIKSEPIPKSNDGPVKVLVYHNFEEIVVNSKKNALIEFYAPWCGHCKSLAPVYEEVGKHFSSDPDVVITKMDATANDMPMTGFNVQGFPTLYLRAADGTITQYEGDRSKDSLIEFVKKHKTGPAEASSDDHDEL